MTAYESLLERTEVRLTRAEANASLDDTKMVRAFFNARLIHIASKLMQVALRAIADDSNT